MTVGLSITVTVGVAGDYTNTAGLAAQDAHVSKRTDLAFLTGTGLNQANKLYTSAVSLAASATSTLDLTSLLDALGAALAFGAVKALVLFADATNTNNIVLGNAASNQFAAPFDAATDTISVPPGGQLVLTNPSAAGWTVDSTHKSLKLANSGSGTGVTGELVILGD